MNIKLIPLELGRGGALDGAAAATERREMKDHIDTLREGMEKVKDGFSMMNGGPMTFTLDCLLAAYNTLVNEYAAFKVGQCVELRAVPKAALVLESGWWHCQHFLVPGNEGTIRHVSCDSDGRLRYDVIFDRETWIDRDGKEQPVISKHVFSLFEKELIGYQEIVR